MRSQLALASLPLVVTLATACTKPAGDPTPPNDAATVTDAPAMTASPPPVPLPIAPMIDAGPEVHSRTEPGFARLSLFEKLAVEKNNRPANTLKSDTVFDELAAKLSITVTERGQLAGFTVLASYCEKAGTDLAVDVLVCEYPNSATLAEGKAIALKAKTPRREILTVKTSWVSLTRFDDTPAATEQAKRIAAFVKTL